MNVCWKQLARGFSLALVGVLGASLSACAVVVPEAEFLPLSPMEIVAASGGVYKVGEPYTVLGQSFTPQANEDYDRTGIASWYAEEFHGKKTANGETYDMNLHTAAHPTLPMPSWVEVTNLQNGRKLAVRVNDRGPFAKGREIDLSLAVAQDLGLFQQGHAMVRVRYLGRAPVYSKRGRLLDEGEPVLLPPSAVARGEEAIERLRSREQNSQQNSQYNRQQYYQQNQMQAAGRGMGRDIPVHEGDPYLLTRDGGYILHIGTYTRRDSALALARQFQMLADWRVSRRQRGARVLYRVHSPLLLNATEAEELRRRLRQLGHSDSLIIRPR